VNIDEVLETLRNPDAFAVIGIALWAPILYRPAAM
jgi:hypothetical protein